MNDLVVCPSCGVKVMPMRNGGCPSCRKSLLDHKIPARSQSGNDANKEKTGQDWLFQAEAASGQGEYGLAIDLCNSVIAVEPGRIAAYLTRGAAYYHSQNTDAAAADYGTAIRIDAQCVAAWIPSSEPSDR
jgi:tetratricopeptide (TPR) repeat protein